MRKKDPYPLPNIESTIRSITIAKGCSKIHLSNAYHQLPVDSITQRLFGFILPGDFPNFSELQLIFETFLQKFKKIDIITADSKRCFICLDDIIVFGSTKEEHGERLNAVLNRLHFSRLVATLDKCEVDKPNIEWFGLKLCLSEFAILENNLTSIAEMKVPYDEQSLASTLCLLSRYRNVLPSNYSSKAADLYKLLHQNVVFK